MPWHSAHNAALESGKHGMSHWVAFVAFGGHFGGDYSESHKRIGGGPYYSLNNPKFPHTFAGCVRVYPLHSAWETRLVSCIRFFMISHLPHDDTSAVSFTCKNCVFALYSLQDTP